MAHDTSDREEAFPRAPSQEEWEAMRPEEQARVVESLPGEVTYEEMAMPEGDEHSDPKLAAREQLKSWLRRSGRRAYVATELPVYYPAEARFAPDLLVVLDVAQQRRRKWVVSHEGKGLDWVMEVHAGGDRKKDAVHNVKRYARLGVAEYFLFDGSRQELKGYRLPRPGATRYVRIKPRKGRLPSRVLGLELTVEEGLVWFWSGEERLLDLEAQMERAERESRRADEESRRADEESRRADEESRRRAEAEQQVARLRAELERLEGRGTE